MGGRIVVILFSLVLSGCGIAAKIDARKDMEQSKATYKDCLAQNSSKPSNCESARLAFEADMKTYRATSAGIQPGYNNTLNVTTTNDQ
jgi:hypothetical protein